MEIKLQEISFKNFLRFGEKPQTFKLDRQGKHLIMGKYSSGKRNGCGKSSITDGISFALFGRPLRKLKVGSVANNVNKRNCVVTLHFLVGSTQYKIIRGRNPNIIQLWENDKDITGAVQGDINDKIQKLVGMDFRTFQFLIVFAAASMIPFLDLGKQDVRVVTERILNMTKITDLRVEMQAERQTLQKEIAIEKARINLLESQNEKNEAFLDQMNEKMARWDEDRKRKIEHLQSEKDNLEAIDVGSHRDMLTKLEKSKELILDLESEHEELFRSVDSDGRNLGRLAVQYKAEKKFKFEKEKFLEDLKAGLCPTCGSSFTDNSLIDRTERDIFKVRNRIGNISIELLETKRKNDIEIANVSVLDGSIKEEESKLETIKKTISVDNLQKLDRISDNIAVITTKLDEVREEENPYDGMHAPEIIDIDYTALHDDVEKYKNYEYLIKFLDNTGIAKKTMVGKIMPFLNGRISYYLNTVQSEYDLRFDNYFTPTISQNGRDVHWRGWSQG